jgi:hypothetical protein
MNVAANRRMHMTPSLNPAAEVAARELNHSRQEVIGRLLGRGFAFHLLAPLSIARLRTLLAERVVDPRRGR